MATRRESDADRLFAPIPKMTNQHDGRSIFVPFCESNLSERRRRNLPHWSQTDCTYFVTYRLADSLPKLKLLDLQRQKVNWLRMHPTPWSPAIERDFHLLFD